MGNVTKAALALQSNFSSGQSTAIKRRGRSSWLVEWEVITSYDFHSLSLVFCVADFFLFFRYSLTIWHSTSEVVLIADLLEVYNNFPPSKVYFDIPDEMMQELLDAIANSSN